MTPDADDALVEHEMLGGRRDSQGGPMITTVTPNPSLDRTLHLSRFMPSHVNRATATWSSRAARA